MHNPRFGSTYLKATGRNEGRIAAADRRAGRDAARASMSHFVTGLIARAPTLEVFATLHKLHQPIALVQGFSILPLREQDLQSLSNEPTSFLNGFNHWSESLSNKLANASKAGTIVYFETEYTGGTGAQAAAVYNDGSLAFGPKSSKDIGPINEALRILGVVVQPTAYDEFETIGLKRHRHTKDWLQKS